jgi:hypothetical protein
MTGITSTRKDPTQARQLRFLHGKLRPESLLVTAILVLYLAYLTHTYYWDGVLFSIYIEDAAHATAPVSSLIHPNHLLYNVLGFAVYRAASGVGVHARAITLLQIMDALASIAAAWLLYRFAEGLTGSKNVAILCCLLFATGATWWKFSTDADAYTVAVLCEIAACYFALCNSPRWALAGAFHIGGMLVHELAIFVYFPVLAAIWIRERRRAVRIGILYLLTTGGGIAAAYMVSYSLVDHHTYPNIVRWMTSYSGARFTNSLADLTKLYLASYPKLFGGGKIGFLRTYFSAPVCMGLLVCIASFVCGLRIIKKKRWSDGAPATGDPVLLWAWFVPYAIFLALFDPGSTFHKLFLWPALVLLIGVYVSRSRFMVVRVAALLSFAIALAGWNFAAFIYPHSRASADPVLVLAQKINRESPKNATVYYTAFSPDDWYLRYFAPGRRWVQLSEKSASRQALSAPGPVCFETTAVDVLAHGPETKPGLQTTRSWNLVTSQHNIRFECFRTVP